MTVQVTPPVASKVPRAISGGTPSALREHTTRLCPSVANTAQVNKLLSLGVRSWTAPPSEDIRRTVVREPHCEATRILSRIANDGTKPYGGYSPGNPSACGTSTTPTSVRPDPVGGVAPASPAARSSAHSVDALTCAPPVLCENQRSVDLPSSPRRIPGERHVRCAAVNL